VRLQNFILNEGRSKPISREDAIKFIRKNSLRYLSKIYRKGHLNDDACIYRGVDKASNISFVSPSKSIRSSLNTENYYTLLIDNGPLWKNYPKRSESIICSTNASSAKKYGDLFLVIPKDTAKIGICPVWDIWFSFQDSLGTELTELNKIIKIFSLMVDMPLADKQRDFGALVKVFKKIDEIPRDEFMKLFLDKSLYYFNEPGYYFYKSVEKILTRFLKESNSLEFTNKLLSPDRNKFSSRSPYDMPTGTGQEVWTDSDSVLLKIGPGISSSGKSNFEEATDIIKEALFRN
jgi:hypothetical protein